MTTIHTPTDHPITVYWWSALANQVRTIRVATTSHLSTSIQSVSKESISEPSEQENETHE